MSARRRCSRSRPSNGGRHRSVPQRPSRCSRRLVRRSRRARRTSSGPVRPCAAHFGMEDMSGELLLLSAPERVPGRSTRWSIARMPAGRSATSIWRQIERQAGQLVVAPQSGDAASQPAQPGYGGLAGSKPLCTKVSRVLPSSLPAPSWWSRRRRTAGRLAARLELDELGPPGSVRSRPSRSGRPRTARCPRWHRTTCGTAPAGSSSRTPCPVPRRSRLKRATRPT